MFDEVYMVMKNGLNLFYF